MTGNGVASAKGADAIRETRLHDDDILEARRVDGSVDDDDAIDDGVVVAGTISDSVPLAA